jgi:hypothetical protein
MAINGHHWLMYYESVLRGWTKDKGMIDEVKNHNLMGKLLSGKISFLDDTVFGDVTINLDRRRIRKNRPANTVQYAEESDDDISLGLASI